MEAATKKYVDDAVQTGGGSPGGDVSKEYVDQQISELQGQIDAKVSKSGDTMSGALNFNGQTALNPVLESNTGIKVTLPLPVLIVMRLTRSMLTIILYR